MSFELKRDESTGHGIRRIAKGQIESALGLVEKKDAEPNETVHELRKYLKKFRAVVRLVRDEIGDDVYRRENGAARDLGRRLSAVRDAAVNVSALEMLRKTYTEDFPDGVDPVRRGLASRHRSAVRRLEREKAFAGLAGGLEDVRRRLRTWRLRRDGFDCLEPGLRRTYRLGREAEDEAFDERTDAAFHEWRKRAKDLRYHFELLNAIWPAGMKAEEQALHDLTDALGEDHDLGELHRVLITSPHSRGEPGVARLVELVERRRSELQAKAAPMGDRIYAEKPRDFVRRLESYWIARRADPKD